MEIMNWSELDLPGFRFHPTEEELLEFYLKGAVRGKKLQPEIIHTLNIYRYHPVELPGMARNIGEREWYFFVPRDRRSSNGGRPSRTTDKGFWKATGTDRTIRSAADPRRKIGTKKTLVFYEGRAPRGTRTDWVMNEYRLPEADNTTADVSSTRASDIVMLQVDMVLCKIYRKATSMRELEQRAAMDKDACRGGGAAQCGSNSSNTSGATSNLVISSSSSDQKTTAPLHKLSRTVPVVQQLVMGEEVETKKEIMMKVETSSTETEKDQAAEVTSLAVVGSGDPAAALTRTTTTLPELDKLQVPPREGFFDWAQHDPFLAQLRSPWLDNWSPLYANILHFSS